MATSCPAQIPRIPWTPAEDAELKRAVAVHGDKRWSQISTCLPGRTSKACSHRWRTYLQPGVMHASSVPFSEWEKAVVKEAHKAVGNNWAVIARMLPGRTNAAVKNFWYSYKRRCGKAHGRRHVGQSVDGDDASDMSDTDEEDLHDDEVVSADEMDCEGGYEVGCEDAYEDDDMAAADYAFDHTHTMEGVDCSATWQMAGLAELADEPAATAAAEGQGWVLKHEPHSYPAAAVAAAAGPAAGEVFRTPDRNQVARADECEGFEPAAAGADATAADPWAFAAAGGVHGSNGGAGSNMQQTMLESICQQQQQWLQQAQQSHHHQQQQEQQQCVRSCTPRRSSHHSWSGAPRSMPGAPAATADMFGGIETPGGLAAGEMQAAEQPEAAAAAAAEVDEAFPPMFGRVSQPRMSGHGFLEPQHLCARSSARFISSNQLFDNSACPLPFNELHSRQVTTSNTGHDTMMHNQPEPQNRSDKRYRFALDLSAIKESEHDTDPPAAVTAEATDAPTAGQWASFTDPAATGGTMAAGAPYRVEGLDSECAQSSHLAGSSGKSTGLQQDWLTDHQQIQMIIDAAAEKIRQQQAAAAAALQPQQQEQQGMKRVLEQQHACMTPPRKLVRPSLCSDAGTAPQQQAAVATVLLDSNAAAKVASEQPHHQQGMSTGSRRFVLDLSDNALEV